MDYDTAVKLKATVKLPAQAHLLRNGDKWYLLIRKPDGELHTIHSTKLTTEQKGLFDG